MRSLALVAQARMKDAHDVARRNSYRNTRTKSARSAGTSNLAAAGKKLLNLFR